LKRQKKLKSTGHYGMQTNYVRDSKSRRINRENERIYGLFPK